MSIKFVEYTNFTTLIFYYSKTGKTAKIAEIVLPTIKAESRKIVEPGDWWDKLRIRRARSADTDSRPILAKLKASNNTTLFRARYSRKVLSMHTYVYV